MIYLASSWRNERQPAVLRALRAAGFDVYDFRHPIAGENGFGWSEIDPEWRKWNPEQFIAALEEPPAQRGFAFDFSAMNRCQACVLLQPCGDSAHLEWGTCWVRASRVSFCWRSRSRS